MSRSKELLRNNTRYLKYPKIMENAKSYHRGKIMLSKRITSNLLKLVYLAVFESIF